MSVSGQAGPVDHILATWRFWTSAANNRPTRCHHPQGRRPAQDCLVRSARDGCAIEQAAGGHATVDNAQRTKTKPVQDDRSVQPFLSTHATFANHFQVQRHLLSCRSHQISRAARRIWHRRRDAARAIRFCSPAQAEEIDQKIWRDDHPQAETQVGGGETGIRTLGWLSPSTVFKTAAFDHSATSPVSAV